MTPDLALRLVRSDKGSRLCADAVEAVEEITGSERKLRAS